MEIQLLNKERKHSIVVHESSTIFEAKDGAYIG